jgi:hypothetical protein
MFSNAKRVMGDRTSFGAFYKTAVEGRSLPVDLLRRVRRELEASAITSSDSDPRCHLRSVGKVVSAEDRKTEKGEQ